MNSCLLFILFLTSVCFPRVASAADDSPQNSFYLPKSPAAAAYVLGRLSNLELIAAPRSEFVYVAILERQGLDRKYRLEALDGLAKIRTTDRLTELIRGISDVSKKAAPSESVLRDLAALLLQSRSEELQSKREALHTLTQNSPIPLVRQIGYAALVTADQSLQPAWQQLATAPTNLPNLILSSSLVRDDHLRTEFYHKLEPLLHQSDQTDVRRAAITAIPILAGHELEIFRTLAGLAKSGTERTAAIMSLRRIPKAAWPKDEAPSLLSNLVDYVRSVPVEQRTGPDALDAFQFATDLTTLLPPDEAKNYAKSLRALGVSVFVIHTIKEQMLYDKTLLVAEAGKPLQIVLVNEDSMPHNLVVTAPGSVEQVGQAAEKMPLVPDAQGRLYIPDSTNVLYATRLVDPGQSAQLSFVAPSTPGDYQYICTFPGHWRRMMGTLVIVQDVEAYFASHAAPAEPKMTEWKLEDLAPDLPKVGYGRSLEAGRTLFTKLACIQCHRIGGSGYAYGPDLTEVFHRWKGDRASVLQQILEPSKLIEDRYRPIEFELKDGDDVTGFVLGEDSQTVRIQTGASDALIQILKKSDITGRQPQSSSVMPVGLLSPLSKDQILDLLAFLESGGALSVHAHAHVPAP